MTTPLVSVITPTYNSESFLAETVASVLGQTYADVQHVLVDDGSTDGTPDLLRELARTDPRVEVQLHGERAGPCRRRNDALALTRGDLLAWLDHDDVWLSTKLERQVPELRPHDVAFVFGQYEEFDGATSQPIFRSTLTNGNELYERLFVEGCFIASSTVVFRRAAMQRRTPRLRDVDFSFGDDYALWLTLLLDGRAVLVDDVLVRLRRHRQNESARLAQRNYHLDRIQLLEEHLADHRDASKRLGSARREGLASHYAAAAQYELEHGRRLRGARLAARAARRRPLAFARFVAGSALAKLRRAAPQT